MMMMIAMLIMAERTMTMLILENFYCCNYLVIVNSSELNDNYVIVLRVLCAGAHVTKPSMC